MIFFPRVMDDETLVERLTRVETLLDEVDRREKEDRTLFQAFKEGSFKAVADKLDDLRTKVYIGLGIAMAVNVAISKGLDFLQ